MYQNPEEFMISGNSITVLNASEILSMEFPAQAVLTPMANGWNMVIQQDCKVSVTFKTGARRMEIQLSTGDEIYRDHQDVIISRKSVSKTERGYRSTTSTQIGTSYTPPDYSELIQQVRSSVMQDLESMMRQVQTQQPQPSEKAPEEGKQEEQ